MRRFTQLTYKSPNEVSTALLNFHLNPPHKPLPHAAVPEPEVPEPQSYYPQLNLFLEEDPVRLSNFRGVSYIGKRKFESVILERSQAFPATFSEAENWWEYEDFKKFELNTDYLNLRLREWHKHMLRKGFLQYYSPIWDPEITFGEHQLFLHYFTNTLKIGPSKQYPLSTAHAYQGGRPVNYFLFVLFVYLVYTGAYYIPRKKAVMRYLNEDYWLMDIKLGRRYFEGMIIGSGNASRQLAEAIPIPLTSIVFNFRYGPQFVDKLKADSQKLSTLRGEELENFLREKQGLN